MSDRVEIRTPIDAFVIPITLVPNEGFPYPFVAYGPSELINLAAIRGCFDYMKEPWDFDELMFRINLFVRYRLSLKDKGDGLYIADSYLRYRSKGVFLTLGEVKILKVLMNNTGKVVDREVLSYALWGSSHRAGSRAIDMHVSSLRRKIDSLLGDENGNITAEIHSARGVGYIFLQGILTRR